MCLLTVDFFSSPHFAGNWLPFHAIMFSSSSHISLLLHSSQSLSSLKVSWYFLSSTVAYASSTSFQWLLTSHSSYNFLFPAALFLMSWIFSSKTIMLLSHFASILVNLASLVRTSSIGSTINKWFNSPWLPNYCNNKHILKLFLPIHKVSPDFQMYCNTLQFWIPFTKSSSSSIPSTRFLYNASTFVCLELALWIILKLKSCSLLIHLPFLLHAFEIVANHSKGLWSVWSVKWVQYKYLKCMIPHTKA